MDEQNQTDKAVNVGKYQVKVVRSLCIGDGTCDALASKTFELDGENKSVVQEGSTDNLETILAAAQSCPANCIIITDSETGKQLWPK